VETTSNTIVVIDDDYAMRLSCGKILRKSGLRVETFQDGAQGLEAVASLKPGLVLVDLKMPGLSGVEVIGRVREIDSQAVIIVITGYATVDTAVEAMRAGAYDFLPKPFSPDELRLIVSRGLERRRLVLESQRGEVERAVMKRRFVTFVSHQLQTPLVAIHQYLTVLNHLDESPQTAEKRREWIDRCLHRTEELQGIIRDWLVLSRVEGDTIGRQRVRVELKQVIADVLQANEDMAHDADVKLELRLPGEAYAVRGDRTCLGVLFDNLVANAIKYNRRGGAVTVSAEIAGGEVVVSIADTGIGIPEEFLPRVFDEFFRIRGGDGGSTLGTGLGLPIARRVVTEMGGTITVESQVGAGSTFRVRLPEYRGES
jgi:signal transduction histidine kinase